MTVRRSVVERRITAILAIYFEIVGGLRIETLGNQKSNSVDPAVFRRNMDRVAFGLSAFL